MNKPIDWSKELTTRDGRKVRLLGELVGPTPYPMIVAVMDSGGSNEWSANYTKDGTYSIHEAKSRLDIINTPVRIKLEYWVNVYPTGLPSGPYADRDTAESVAHPLRVACIKQVIDCAEGEGL